MTNEGNRKVKKCFAFPTGNTLGSHKEIMKQLTMQGLPEVMSAQECDVILVFCPVVSRVGTDIEEAFTHVPEVSTDKPVILVVMHHTFKLDYTAYDSSRYVSRKDVILTVDCLFHDCKGGLLKCGQNDAAVKQIVRKLAPTANALNESDGQNSANNFVLDDHQREEKKDAESKPTGYSTLTSTNERLQQKGKKFYTKVTGNTLGSHENIKSQLMKQHLLEVDSLDECDVILAFCSIISRAGSDIEAACRMIPAGKPVVLVVLHHTFNPDYTVPDVKKHVTIPDVILLVNFLFHDSMGGLLKCGANDAAFKEIIEKLARTANAFNQSDGQNSANNDHQREEKKDAESKPTGVFSRQTMTNECRPKMQSFIKVFQNTLSKIKPDFKQKFTNCRDVEAVAKDLQGQNNCKEDQLQEKDCKMEDTSQRLKDLDEERKIENQSKESNKPLHAQNSEIENRRQQLRESEQKLKKTQYEDGQVLNVTTRDTELTEKPNMTFYTIVEDNTFGSPEKKKIQLIEQSLTKVNSPEECDVIIAFCPMDSSVLTAIKDVLTTGKPFFLVGMHNTSEADSSVNQCSKEDVVLPVDFFTDSSQFLQCPKNEDFQKIYTKLTSKFQDSTIQEKEENH